jgi:hypothetical protein
VATAERAVAPADLIAPNPNKLPHAHHQLAALTSMEAGSFERTGCALCGIHNCRHEHGCVISQNTRQLTEKKKKKKKKKPGWAKHPGEKQ